MKKLLYFLFLLCTSALLAETPLPDKPDNHVFDDANVFDQSARDRLAGVLDKELKNYNIMVYVITLPDLDKDDPVAFAERMQKAWITQPSGIVLLYIRNKDKVSISLTPVAFKKLSAEAKLNELASAIDRYNDDGPTRGIPKAINAILDHLRVSKDDVTAFFQPEKETSKLLLYIPFGIVLSAIGLGLWKLYLFLKSYNVFDFAYQLHSRPVRPRFGAPQGGSNMGFGKFG